jgi:DNA-binding transcriptional regulator LsrR (DeoR family)
LSHAELKAMAKDGHIILIAGGDVRKYPAIKSALREGFASVFVTETETATAILQ